MARLVALISTLAVLAGFVPLAGCAHEREPNTIEHPDLAVVRIVNFPQTQRESMGILKEGTGFFVSQDGLIVTCRTGMPEHGEIGIMQSNGQILPAEFIEENRDSDLAILQVHGKNFPFLKLHDEDVAPGIHVRIVTSTAVVHGLFDHWEDFGKDMGLTTSATSAADGSPVLADDGGVIGVVRCQFTGHVFEERATPIWNVVRMMPRLSTH